MQDRAHNNMPLANSLLKTKSMNPLRRHTDSEAVESIRLRRVSAHVKDIFKGSFTTRHLLQSLKRVVRKVAKREQPKQSNSQAASMRALLDGNTPIYRTISNTSTTAVLGAPTPALRPRSYDAEMEYIRQELLVEDWSTPECKCLLGAVHHKSSRRSPIPHEWRVNSPQPMGVEDAVTDISPQETVSSARRHIAVLEDASATAHRQRPQTPRVGLSRTWVAPASWSGPSESNVDVQAS
ncbi:hypothetical protein FB567DRAFT_296020 [Paraphoma chrysanthemicola]|uniref:Uncharacterized protein n=1 Tax=Paraphoma chrysanthemicola TaxID=798071 RepID=A0A8K0R999_9PLEO|nr:hypothetical protein FB567DRAFT_296020 [Paraphoma chrysanthemicola]